MKTPPPDLIDSHCHLDMAAYQADLDEIISSAASVGVTRIITIGIDLASSERAVQLAEKHPGIFATVGFHPHDADKANPAHMERLKTLAARQAVVGWGEIGLDYVKEYSPRKTQQLVFAQQVQMARETGLPVVIHDREAHDDTIAILKEAGPLPAGGVMHCFSGDVKLADAALALGFHISIPGIVTFNNAASLREVVAHVTLDRLLLESDGPFLAPVPFRGKRNTPAMLVHTAKAVASIKEVPLEMVAGITTANAARLFRLPVVRVAQ